MESRKLFGALFFGRVFSMFLMLVFFNGCSHTGADTKRSPAATEEEALREAVNDFEAMGGSGTWFKSVMPDRLGGKSANFYFVRSMPQASAPEAKVFLLRTDKTRGVLTDVFSLEHAPVVFGPIPDGGQAGGRIEAAAIGGFQLAQDALRVGKIKDKKNIILLRESASIYTLAHENRHWLDYENKAFMQEMNESIEAFLNSNGLNAGFGPLLSQIVIEIRGHITQAKQARKARQGGWPYVERAGGLGDPAQAAADYGFEENFARTIFEQAYLPVLFQIFSKLEPQQEKALLAILGKYDSSDDPQNKITFKKAMGIK